MIISHDYFKTAQAFIPDQQYVKARPKLLEQYYDFNVTSTSARQDPHIGGNLCLDPILPGPEYLVQRARSRIFSRKYGDPSTRFRLTTDVLAAMQIKGSSAHYCCRQKSF
jgi:hypothetical protein